MRLRRLVLVLPVLSFAAGCGSQPSAPTHAASGSLHGRVVDGLTTSAAAGILVSGGTRSVTSDANGDFALDPSFETEVGATYTFTGSGFVERRTALKSSGPTALVSLIPGTFDLRAFDEMFRSSQLVRWRQAPPLRVEMRVGRFVDLNALDIGTLDNVISDAEKDSIVDDLTWALPQLTGNTFTAFPDVTTQTSLPNATVGILNPGVITVIRLKGLTAGSGFWGYSRWRFLSDGTVTGGLITLDEDFELSLHPRRRALRAHELGHALGMGHVTARQSIMNANISVFEPNDFDRQAARLAFQRPPGNRSPDVDPSGYSTNASTGTSSARWSGPIK